MCESSSARNFNVKLYYGLNFNATNLSDGFFESSNSAENVCIRFGIRAFHGTAREASSAILILRRSFSI